MKTRIFLSIAALGLAACGSSDRVWTTSDLQYIPLIGTDEEGSRCATYIDTKTGKEAGQFFNGTLFFDDCALVHTLEDGWYFVDHELEPLTGEFYHAATNFDDGIAWAVKPAGPLTAIDKKGRVLFELKQAESAVAFHEGMAVFRDAEGLWGLVDRKGRVVAEPQWAETGPMMVNGLLPVQSEENDLWGLVNRKGETVVECRFHSCLLEASSAEGSFASNYVQALREERIPFQTESGKWGVADAEGNYLVNPQFDEIYLDGAGYMFRKGRLVGWCDKEGKYVINPQFRDAYPFGDSDLAAVEDEDGEWGYIDREGKWVINPQFREAGPFLPCGVAAAKDRGSREWGVVDKEGKWVVNPQFEEMYEYGADDRFLVEDQSGGIGIVGADGHYVVMPNYRDYPAYLPMNVGGVSVYGSVRSDYVDVENYARLIEEQILALKRSTAGELKTAYGLRESNFPKGGGTVTLCKKKAASDMTFKVQCAGVNAWSKTSDGWFGYNYTFLPGTAVNSYTFSVEWAESGRAWRFVGEIFEELTKKYPFDKEAGTISIPGYSPILVAETPSDGMVFHVKPE